MTVAWFLSHLGVQMPLKGVGRGCRWRSAHGNRTLLPVRGLGPARWIKRYVSTLGEWCERSQLVGTVMDPCVLFPPPWQEPSWTGFRLALAHFSFSGLAYVWPQDAGSADLEVATVWFILFLWVRQRSTVPCTDYQNPSQLSWEKKEAYSFPPGPVSGSVVTALPKKNTQKLIRSSLDPFMSWKQVKCSELCSELSLISFGNLHSSDH